MAYHDIKTLRRAGYIVEEKSPWHFQVTQNGVTCNIWPTSQKYMVEWGGGASYYSDVVEAVASIVGQPGKEETRAERIERLKKYWAEEIPVPMHPELFEAHIYELGLLTGEIKRRAAKAERMDF